MEKPAVSLVCPAYHDERNIGPLVRRCVEILRPHCSEFEIIIVEDGSPDGTGAAADRLAVEFPEVSAVHHKRNLGHGAALKSGMKRARMPLIALMDGDAQYEPADLLTMTARIGEFDLVQGRRPKYPNGFLRSCLSRLYNIVVRLVFGAPFSDLGCSIKVFRREALEKALPNSDGIFAQGEFVIRARAAGFKVGEQDVACYPRPSGRSHSLLPKNVLRMLLELIRLRLDLSRRR